MGWLELQGWIKEFNRQHHGHTDPGSWDGHEGDSNWIELRRQRDRFRGKRR